jgi:hypothetical protein
VSDVGQEKMWEMLCGYLKTTEKIKNLENTSEYIKTLYNEILLYGDFKVLHITDSEMITIHYQGSMLPCGMARL